MRPNAPYHRSSSDPHPLFLMRLITCLLAAFALLVALGSPAFAREEIRAMASDVTLRVDGSVLVVETIDIRAEGDQIRRGIYRDIPVTMLGEQGNKIRIALDVQAVTRDGKPEKFRVERVGDFRRIWIGNSEVLLRRGDYRYVVTYAMERMARPTDGGDELYWNATGNYWDFPIRDAVARIRLPDSAVIDRLVAYTGPLGSRERAVTITRESDHTAIFRSRRELAPGEGMTIALSFQKGVVSYPEGGEALWQSLSDLREVWLPIGAVLVLLLYNFTAWLRVGRDPPRGTVIPLFHAPKGFSPALAHYVHKWGFANSGWTAMTAAIFDLGVKGLVKIDNSGKTLTVTATGEEPDTPLPPGEQILFAYFSGKGAVSFDKANGTELGAKRTEFIGAITRENRTRWFNHNTMFAVVSFFLAATMMLFMVIYDVLDPEWLIIGAMGGVFIGVIGSLIFSTLRSGGWQRFLVIAWVGIFAFNFGGGLLESLTGLTINTATLAAGSLVAISLVFAVLMRAPTVQGRKVMDEIDGFKLYLETAEKNRLNIVDEPPMSIERFERILPYAIALEVEKPWSEHFEAELSRNAVSDATPGSYSPHFYSGSRPFSAGGLSRAISTASSGMAAAMIAAQPVQASSSGTSSSGGGGW